MKRSNKFLVATCLGLAVSSLSFLGVSATSKSFSGNLPRFQGWAYVTAAQKSESSNYGTVKLTTLEHDNVTFYAKATGSDFHTGTITNQTGINYNVNYAAVYGTGQEMQARYRNHTYNWNSAKVAGTFNYK